MKSLNISCGISSANFGCLLVGIGISPTSLSFSGINKSVDGFFASVTGSLNLSVLAVNSQLELLTCQILVGVVNEIEAVSASTSFDSLTSVSLLLPLSCLSLVIGADRTNNTLVGIVQDSLSLDIKLRLLVSAGNIVELSRVLVVPGNDIGVHGVGNLASVPTNTAGFQL